MYKYREITRFNKGCPAMCGDPSNWIGWALDKEDADRLMIVSESGILCSGAYWDKCRRIADVLVDSNSDEVHKCFKLGSMLGDSVSDGVVDALIECDCRGDNPAYPLYVVAKALLGHRPDNTIITERRQGCIALYWFGDAKETPAHVEMIVESFYYNHLVEMELDYCEMVCVPEFYAEDLLAKQDADVFSADLSSCGDWLRSTGRIEDNEMLIVHRDSYGVDELLGFDAVHNAIRGYMDCMDSDFATMSSDVSYTIEDVICNLKEGNYRFDINGNLRLLD